MMPYFSRKCACIISRIFFQGSNLEASTFSILPEDSKDRFSDDNQGTCWVRRSCFLAGLSIARDPVSFAAFGPVANTQNRKCAEDKVREEVEHL